MAKQQKFYVVWKGVEPGIYSSWTDCQLQIKNYKGAIYKSFSTREEAEHAFATPAHHYLKGSRSQASELSCRRRGLQRESGTDGIQRGISADRTGNISLRTDVWYK